jgi:hypothetical protein
VGYNQSAVGGVADRGHESWEDKTSVEYPLILASGDAAGSVIVWDVLKAEIKATMGASLSSIWTAFS